MEASFLLLFYLLFLQRRRAQAAQLRRLLQNRRREGLLMLEAARRYLGRRCFIHLFNAQIVGTIVEVADGAVIVETDGAQELLNPDFIVRIRDYPQRKKKRTEGGA